MNKKEYILKQLRRTNNKSLENYCITRILHKLDNTDVEFVTQQLFYRKNGIALGDLYFPQIDLIVEIDEDHHLKDREEDQKREQEIINQKIASFEEIISTDNPFQRIAESEEIESINERIDEVVGIIEKRIYDLGDTFVPWNNVFNGPEYYIEKGFIDLEDHASFRTIKEVSELFNKQYGKSVQTAWFADYRGSLARVWCPKLVVNGLGYDVPYSNEITKDGITIFEKHKTESKNLEFVNEGINSALTTRYVFAMYRDSTQTSRYRFRGIFTLNPDKSKIKNMRVWERTGISIDLTQYF